MTLLTGLYTEQTKIWPTKGRHILAHYDEQSVIVYQAYRPSIANFAVEHGVFGGDFDYGRMSWIKPNFLWMMYRSGWGTKKDQEVTLALRVRRSFFDSLLAQAVPTSWDQMLYATQDEWAKALAKADVLFQWDLDHDPLGNKVERRAIQLGLRGEILKSFGQRELLEVIDLSHFVTAQRTLLAHDISSLRTPLERLYIPK